MPANVRPQAHLRKKRQICNFIGKAGSILVEVKHVSLLFNKIFAFYLTKCTLDDSFMLRSNYNILLCVPPKLQFRLSL